MKLLRNEINLEAIHSQFSIGEALLRTLLRTAN